MAKFLGWWTVQCVCQEGLGPPNHGVTVSHADLVLQCWRQQWLHHWDLWDRDSAGTQLHSAQAHRAKTASYHFSNSPQINRKQIATIYLFSFFFNQQDCCNDFHFEMSQMYKKEKCSYFFFSVSEIWLSWMSIPKSSVIYEKWSLLFSECLMILKEDKLTLDLWKKGKMNSNISTDCMS